MDHVAIDLGAYQSQICCRAPDGTIRGEWKIPTPRLPAWLKTRAASRVILEACAETFAIADAAREAGHEVTIVAATLTRTLGVGHRGVKNDVKDARVLSMASCRMELPSIHTPSRTHRNLKAMLTARAQLVKTRRQLICAVRSYLRQRLMRIPSGIPNTFAQRVRHATLAQAEGLPIFIERQLETIEFISEQLKAANQEIQRIAQASPICQLLMTMPGIGVISATRFMATIDDPARFSSAAALQSYLGLTPGEHSSGTRQLTTGITKAGPIENRWLLVQSAWTLWRTQPKDPCVQWAQRIAQRRNRRIAITALARKIAGILWSMWKHNTSYDPRRSATVLTDNEEGRAA